jgi:hypothetical protein
MREEDPARGHLPHRGRTSESTETARAAPVDERSRGTRRAGSAAGPPAGPAPDVRRTAGRATTGTQAQESHTTSGRPRGSPGHHRAHLGHRSARASNARHGRSLGTGRDHPGRTVGALARLVSPPSLAQLPDACRSCGPRAARRSHCHQATAASPAGSRSTRRRRWRSGGGTKRRSRAGSRAAMDSDAVVRAPTCS